MQIRVTGRHMDVTPALRDHVEQRMRRLEHYFHNLLDAHAILFVEGNDHVTDITVTGNHLTLHVREREVDMYAAVDRAFHRLTRQVRRHKERVRKRKKETLDHAERNLQAAAVAEQEFVEPTEPGGPELEEAAVAVAENPEVVLERPEGPMTLAEAISLLGDNGSEFLVFTNAESQQVDVIYWRDDGHIGHISQA